MQMSKNQIRILMFFCVFEIQIKFWAFSKKYGTESLYIFEITDCETRADINV